MRLRMAKFGIRRKILRSRSCADRLQHRKLCVRKVISENNDPSPIFSIRIRLKPLQLALQNFSAPIGEREKKLNFADFLKCYKILQQTILIEVFRLGLNFYRSPIGTDKFFSANRIGLKRAQNKTIYQRQSESSENFSPSIQLALNNFSAQIGEVSNEFELKKSLFSPSQSRVTLPLRGVD